MQNRDYFKVSLEAGFIIGILIAATSTITYASENGLDSSVSGYLIGALIANLVIFTAMGVLIGVAIEFFYKGSNSKTKIKHVSVRKKK